MAAPEHRPRWVRVDRLLGEHGIGKDTAAGREQFEQWMERRRQEETDPEARKALRRGWCLGSSGFKQRMLRRMEGKLGEHHSGELHLASAQAKAERIVAEELKRRRWKEGDLEDGQRESAPAPGAKRAAARRQSRARGQETVIANAKYHILL